MMHASLIAIGVILVGMGVLGVACLVLGFCRNWFGIAAARHDQKMAVTMTLDNEKVNDDFHKAKDRIVHLSETVGKNSGGNGNSPGRPLP